MAGTRTSGAMWSGTGALRWLDGPGAMAITRSCSRRSWLSSIRGRRTCREVRTRSPSTTIPTTTGTARFTLTSVVHDEPMDPNGHQMLVHQKALEGNLKLERGIGDHLPMWSTEPQVDIDDWHWTTQLNQARAVTFGIAHFRSHYP